MSRLKLTLIAVLILSPLALFGGVGAWALWRENQLWLWWTLPVGWGLAWLLLRRAGRGELLLPEIDSRAHWTPQDQAAAAIVEAEQRRLDADAGVEQLTDLKFFEERTLELATKLAKHYHPKSDNPLDALTIVEILTVTQLVSKDLEDWFQQYIPGSHLITVEQWRLLSKAPAWWRMARNAGWIASVLMNPLNLARYAASKAFVDPATKQLQTNLLGAFFMLYMRQLGYYLIELHSGRLRGGSDQYRRAMRRIAGAKAAEPLGEVTLSDEPVTVTITLVGQVKAGKSSLANCLLGGQEAAVDVLPLTRDVARFELRLEDSKDRLVLLDTPGYGDAGATRGQLDSTHEAARQADLILLVMDARSPAKQADAKMLADLNDWFREQRRFKPPSVVGVVSKIDGLSPLMEWSPPYDWELPLRPKERAIRAAVEYARQAVGEGLAGAVPVCTDREHGRVFGIDEWLLPTIALLLDEARTVSLVRALHRDHDRQKAWQVVKQFVQAGKRINDAIQAIRDPLMPSR